MSGWAITANRINCSTGGTVASSETELWGRRLAVLTGGVWLAGLIVGFQASLVALTAVGFVVAVLGVCRPSVGFFGMVMLCTLDSVTRHVIMTGGLLRWNTFNYWLLVVGLLGLPMILGRRELHTRLALLMLGLMTAEIVMAPHWRPGMLHVLNFSAFFGLLVYFIRTHRDPETWYWQGVVSGVLAGGGGLVYYLQQHSLSEINSNAWAFFPITAVFACCLAVPFAGTRRRLMLLAALASVNFCWVFLSGSRGSMLVASVGMLFLVLCLPGFGRRLLWVAFSAVIALAVLTQFTALQSKAAYRVGKFFDSSQSLASRTSGRSDLVRDACRIFVQHPFGVGTGGFAKARAELTKRYTGRTFAKGSSRMAHSGWCQTLAENGIPGIVVLSFFVCSFAIVGCLRRGRGYILLGFLATLGLGLAFLATEFQCKGIWFLAAAVTVLLSDDAFDFWLGEQKFTHETSRLR